MKPLLELKNTIAFISSIILCQPVFYSIILVLFSSIEVIEDYIRFGFVSALCLFAIYFTFCYFLSAIVLLLPKRIAQIYRLLLFLIAFLSFSVNAYCFYVYETSLTRIMVVIIMATNIQESLEFFKTYLSPMAAVAIIASLIIGSIFVVRCNSIRKEALRARFLSAVLCFILFTGCFLIVSNHNCLHKTTFLKLNTIFNTNSAPDLKAYKHDIVLDIDERVKCKTIVFVIGESFAKQNSSLYGYKKETNPLLSQQNNLYIFRDVASPHTHTLDAIRSIMTTYISETDSTNWYELISIPEIMRAAGYKTYWLSSQYEYGLLDNLVTCFAKICDEKNFISNQVAVNGGKVHDGKLIPVLNDIVESTDEDKFFIINLMGSHCSFKDRYPKEFEHFTPADYEDWNLSADCKQLLAEYDNSILYNDYVIKSIIDVVKEKDAIVIYFSDHGLDVFNTSDNYIGHAKSGNDESVRIGKEIPFMVYITDEYKRLRPEIEKRINNSQSKCFRTDSVMYTIMDIAGISSMNGESYKNKSLFAQ